MRRSNHADVILLDIFERTTPSGPEPFFHVEVEHEVAATFQGGENTPKHLLQLVQTHHVIQAVKGRENRRKPAGQSEVAGVLDDEFHVRGVLPRYLDRPLRAVEARCQAVRYTTAEIQDGASRRKIPQNQMFEDRVRLRREESPMLVVDAREGVICVVAVQEISFWGCRLVVPRCVPAAAPWLWAHLQRGPPLLPGERHRQVGGSALAHGPGCNLDCTAIIR